MITKGQIYTVSIDAESRELVSQLAADLDLESYTFPSAKDFLNAYDGARPACLIAHLAADGEQLQMLDRLVDNGYRLSAVFLAEQPDTQTVVAAMNRGASSVISPPTDRNLLADAITSGIRSDGERQLVDAKRRGTLRLLASLTDKERDVLELVVGGTANKMIARQLDVSVRTVEMRRSSIFKKTRTESVAELVRLVCFAMGEDWMMAWHEDGPASFPSFDLPHRSLPSLHGRSPNEQHVRGEVRNNGNNKAQP